MDTWDGSFLVGYIIGGLVSALVLYLVVRLAVTHAIIAARPKAPTPVVEAPPAKVWFDPDPK